MWLNIYCQERTSSPPLNSELKSSHPVSLFFPIYISLSPYLDLHSSKNWVLFIYLFSKLISHFLFCLSQPRKESFLFLSFFCNAEVMRISDNLASNWNYIWSSSFWIIKFLEVGGFFSPFQGYSNLTLWILSATISFFLIFVALLVEAVATLGSKVVFVHEKTCKGGICCHGYHHCPIDCEEYLKEFMWAM